MKIRKIIVAIVSNDFPRFTVLFMINFMNAVQHYFDYFIVEYLVLRVNLTLGHFERSISQFATDPYRRSFINHLDESLVVKFTESQVFRVSLIAVMYDIAVAPILVLRFVIFLRNQFSTIRSDSARECRGVGEE